MTTVPSTAELAARNSSRCTCPGTGPLRCLDCYGCPCPQHWLPPADTEAVLAEARRAGIPIPVRSTR